MKKLLNQITPLAIAAGMLAAALPAMANDTQQNSFAEDRFERRATEAALWGMPAVNYWGMREGYKNDAGLENHGIVYFSKPMDWKLRITTPNNTTLYIQSFWNVEKDGPMVIEVPATNKDVKLFGTVMNTYQAPLVDIGDQGADKGQGAKFIFLPENYQEPVPEGYIPVYQDTNNAWFLLRTIVKNFEPETLAKANKFVKQFRVYPYNQPELRDSEQFVDGYGKHINTIAPYDATFFDAINDIVQEEQVKPRDKMAMEMLNEIGIEKGKEYKPSKETRSKLDTVMQNTQLELIDSVINAQDKFWEDRKWSYLVNPRVVRETGFTFDYPRIFDYTSRSTLYYSVFSSVVTYGSETNYFVGGQDSEGNTLKGENNYSLHIPADVPVYHFWSALVYDNKSAAFVADLPKPGISGLDEGLVKNADGSIDIYFGPEAPKGKEANWAPTKPGVDYFLLFRFYGVEKELYEGNWKLGNLEKQ